LKFGTCESNAGPGVVKQEGSEFSVVERCVQPNNLSSGVQFVAVQSSKRIV